MRYVLAAVMFVLLSSVALAAPGIPHQFYGTVIVNGAPAESAVVSARINGVEVASTTTADGKYGYSPIFYVDDPNNNRPGKTIEFFVNDVSTGQTATFVNGKSTEINLTVTITESPPGNPGGSGPGGSATTTTTIPSSSDGVTTVCEEKWTCSDWSACKDGIETRMCFDENQCGTENDRPFESNPCDSVKAGSTGIDMTGLFAGVATNPFVGIVVVIIVVTAVYLIKFRKKANEKFKPIPF